MGFIREDGFLLSAIFHPGEKTGWDAASIRAKEPAYSIFGKNAQH
ncbi:MAG TPA: hypothetical protein VFS71_11170 [Flavobacterium sp.]|nr:hypothetical protein [Flavobacterium sp.]HEU4790238.1 hypothetical protein [Flavobacterium sp.]